MKQNKISRSTVLLFLLGAALIVAALIMLVPDLLNYKQSNDTYEALKENYISEKAENTEVAISNFEKYVLPQILIRGGIQMWM